MIQVNSFQRVMVNNQNVILVKDAVVVHSHLTASVGSSKDIKTVLEEKDKFDLTKKFDIPQNPNAAVDVVSWHGPSPVASQKEMPAQESKIEDERSTRVENETKSKTPRDSMEEENQIHKSLANDDYTPIKALSTFNRDWTIKARVTNRSDLRDTQKGGKLLKCELTDFHGTVIEAAFFNDCAKCYDKVLKKNRVYSLSGGKVGIANKRFTQVKNDFSLTFNMGCEIKELEDDGIIDKYGFEFMNLKQLNNTDTANSIDLAAVIVDVGEKNTFTSKYDGQTKFKKQWTVVDDTNYAILITLWGSEFIDKYSSIKAGDVVGIKNAKVSNFGGKSLNTSNNSQIYIQADHKRIKSLS